MATEIKMPQLGESVVEGTITKWLKNEGDTIEEDELLVEVSTDKVDSEVPSSASGTLQKILIQEGETVKVGTPIAVVGEGDAEAGDEQAGDAEAEAGGDEQSGAESVEREGGEEQPAEAQEGPKQTPKAEEEEAASPS